MSSDETSTEDAGGIDPDEVTKDQLVELYKAERAHREKLEEQVDELSQRVDTIDKNKVSETVVNQLIAAIVNDRSTIDFAADPMQNRGVLEDFGQRVETVETELQQTTTRVNDVYDGSADGPTVAWNRVVEMANRMQNNRDHALPNNRVKLFKENIANATGKSKRQASNYIEDFGQEKEGADWQQYKRGRPGTNNSGRKKALIVDLDVWGEDDE